MSKRSNERHTISIICSVKYCSEAGSESEGQFPESSPISHLCRALMGSALSLDQRARLTEKNARL